MAPGAGELSLGESVFRSREKSFEKTVSEWAATAAGYETSPHYFRGPFASGFARVVASFEGGEVSSLEQVDRLVEPISGLDAIRRPLIAAQVLHSMPPRLSDALSDYFRTRIASEGTQGLLEAFPWLAANPSSETTTTTKLLAQTLESFWPVVGSPYRELERAQAEYLRGVVAHIEGNGDQRAACWRRALELLDEVEPADEPDPDRGSRVAANKETLRKNWSSQLTV